jgi:hypothetical protein
MVKSHSAMTTNKEGAVEAVHVRLVEGDFEGVLVVVGDVVIVGLVELVREGETVPLIEEVSEFRGLLDDVILNDLEAVAVTVDTMTDLVEV